MNTKVEITTWGELAILERLLTNYVLSSSKKDTWFHTAKGVLERERTALLEMPIED